MEHRLRKILFSLNKVWFNFNLQTRLLTIATFVISLTTGSLTFWALNRIQYETQTSDTRFARDLGLLLAANVTPLLDNGNYEDLFSFSERFYNNASSIRYILYSDNKNIIFFSIPFSLDELSDFKTLQNIFKADPENLLIIRRPINGSQLTDVFVPLSNSTTNLGFLTLGINLNPTIITTSYLIRDLTTAVFISIWVMVILGAIFNALTITKPIKELSIGVKNITEGNFLQRIDLPLGGEFGELVISFNEMGNKLENYEKKNIEKITSEKIKLETLVLTIADGAILLDSQLQIILINPIARQMLGLNESIVLGKSLVDYLPNEIGIYLLPTLKLMLEEKYVNSSSYVTKEFCFKLLTENQTTVRILSTVVLDQKSKNSRGIVLTLQDVSLEFELNRAKSLFISNVSHELRTPLFNIKSFIETIHEYNDTLTNNQKLEFLQVVNSETNRLSRLVNDVLDLSKFESEKSFKFDSLNVEYLIQQTLQSYQLTAKDKSIKLLVDIDSNLPPIQGNFDLLLQVLSNLVSNSLKFSYEESYLTVRAYELNLNSYSKYKDKFSSPYSNSIVRIEVTDIGIGLDSTYKDNVFDRFSRVENNIHTLEGTGLGLSIVKTILQKHYSDIKLVTKQRFGTVFYFDIKVR